MTNLDICEKCPLLLNNRACSLCGCPVDITTKQPGKSCPDGRWHNA